MLEDQDARPIVTVPATLILAAGNAYHGHGRYPTVADAADDFEEDFALLDDWRDKVELIIDLGKELPAFARGPQDRGQ